MHEQMRSSSSSPLLRPSRRDEAAARATGYASNEASSGEEHALVDSLLGDEDWSMNGGAMGGLGNSLRNRSQSESFVMGETHKMERPIGWAAICFISYFNVSGGPWGSEEIVSSAGPLPGLVGIIMFAVMWALPMILVTAELSSAYPDDGGYSIWVAEAFGPFWGFQEAYWSWVSGVIDTAIYPVLAFDTAVKIFDISTGEGGEAEWLQHYSIKFAMALLFALPNLCATNMFGNWMTILAIFVFLPFLVQASYLVLSESLDLAVLTEVRSDVQWKDWYNLISVLYWNFSGFDAVSTCAGEVRNPGRNYIRGLLLSLCFILVTYYLPLTIFTAVNMPPWQTWSEGSYSEIAQQEVGHWMGLWIVAASLAANTGMYTAEVFEDSWQLCGMARAGLMPSIFGKRYKVTGPPYVAILAALVVICGLIALDFSSIVVITNLFSCLAALLELLAFLKLRLVEPHMHRPFRVPVESMSGLTCFMLLPLSLGILIVLSSLLSSWLSVTINAVALLIGLVMYFFMHKQGHIQYLYSSSTQVEHPVEILTSQR